MAAKLLLLMLLQPLVPLLLQEELLPHALLHLLPLPQEVLVVALTLALLRPQ